MRFNIELVIGAVSLFWLVAAAVNADNGPLTGSHLLRVEQAKQLLIEVDNRTQEEIVNELNLTSNPEGNLQIYEAVAGTYHELADEIGAVTPDDKRNLYESIRMNVAFLQFGGQINHSGDRKINRWIRQTLRRHLSQNLLNDNSLFYSLE